ncbi:MAG: glycine--tRNA ligase subunit beta, partial [Nitrospirae bacterium]|nr:glycine--tRNA ligase subunit beta [Nitrospirota bacterium]
MVKSKATENTSQTSPILLLEVGTEEIPARFFPDTLNRLKENFEKIFSEYRIAARSIKTYATPRRISLIAEVNTMQEAAEKEIWGPPVNAAFDKDGNPTKAAEAFAKTHNIDINGLIKKEKGKGSYIVAVVKEKAQHTEGLMPEILPRLVTSISFPKAMRWGNGDFRFARPIHWILATYDNKKIPFDIDGTRSINMTRGHRFLSPAAFEIKDNRTYMNLLKNNFVVLDPEERKKIILE